MAARPQNLESLRSLAEQIVWVAGEYGIGDTLAGATAFVGFDADKEHFTNYFLCTGTNDQTPILAAVAYVNGLSLYDIKVEAGTYDINNLTVATATEFIGGAGVIWDLPAAPSLTTTATVQFKEITFLSTLDDTGQVLLGGDTYFRFCPFDLQLDTEDSLIGVIQSNAGTPNRVEFLNCTLIGGEDGAEYFGFFSTVEDMDELVVRDFLISSLICNGTPGRFATFYVASGDDINYFEAKNIEIKGVDTTYDGSSFFHVIAGGTVSRVVMDGFMFHSGNTWTNDNSSLNPIVTMDSGVSAPTIGDILLSNWKIYGRSHIIIHGALYLEVDNFENVSPSVIALGSFNAFDCGTTSSYPCYASFNNLTTVDGSLTMNWGWRNMKVTNSTFISSRLAVLMEEEDTDDDPRFVEVSNSFWRQETGGKFDAAFQLSYSQQRGIYLEKLLVSNCEFNNQSAVCNVSTPQRPTHIMLNHISVFPAVDATHPTLFSTGAGFRDADDQVVWISDSDIAGDSPPCGDWNANLGGGSFTGVNDKFDNCRFDDNGTITYSENQGIATVDNGTAVEVVNHGIACVAGTEFPTPGEVSLTGAENHLEAAQMTADTRTATQFSIRFVGGGNVSDDRLVQWRARLTR